MVFHGFESTREHFESKHFIHKIEERKKKNQEEEEEEKEGDRALLARYLAKLDFLFVLEILR